MKVHFFVASASHIIHHLRFFQRFIRLDSRHLPKKNRKTTAHHGPQDGVPTVMNSGRKLRHPSDGLLEIPLRKPAIFTREKDDLLRSHFKFGCFGRGDGWVCIKSFQFPIADIRRNIFKNLLGFLPKSTISRTCLGYSCHYLTWTSLLDVFMLSCPFFSGQPTWRALPTDSFRTKGTVFSMPKPQGGRVWKPIFAEEPTKNDGDCLGWIGCQFGVRQMSDTCRVMEHDSLLKGKQWILSKAVIMWASRTTQQIGTLQSDLSSCFSCADFLRGG